MPGGRLTLNPLAPDQFTDPEDRALVLRAKSRNAAARETFQSVWLRTC
jgi:hypothetical protein